MWDKRKKRRGERGKNLEGIEGKIVRGIRKE